VGRCLSDWREAGPHSILFQGRLLIHVPSQRWFVLPFVTDMLLHAELIYRDGYAFMRLDDVDSGAGNIRRLDADIKVGAGRSRVVRLE
jgi:hypothetical protein